MAEPRAEVKNAADPHQVRTAGRRIGRRELRFLTALRTVMGTPEGRLVFGDRGHGLLARAGVYRSIWEASAKIHYNAGRQDFGHELMAELLRADEGLYQLMETEARLLALRDDAETDAGHTPAATEGRST